jgi:hypothetical protein
MPKTIQLANFHWGIPEKNDEQDYIADLNKMGRQFYGPQDADDVCLALQILVTLHQTKEANKRLHGIAMMVVLTNATHLQSALETIYNNLLKNNKNEYLAVLKIISRKYFKDKDILLKAVSYLARKNIYIAAKAIVSESRLLLAQLPNRNKAFASLSQRITSIDEYQFLENTQLDAVNEFHQNTIALNNDITAAIQQSKNTRQEVATRLTFPCEFDDVSEQFTITVGNYSFPLYYNSIERIGEDTDVITYEILRYISDELIKTYEHFIAENNLSSNHLISRANNNLTAFFKDSNSSSENIQRIILYINILLEAQAKVVPYEDALIKIKAQSIQFIAAIESLEQAGKTHKEFLVDRENLAEDFAVKVFEILNPMQASSLRTLQLIDMIFYELYKKPRILNAFKYASLQNFAKLAWGIVDGNIQPLQMRIFYAIMFATIGKNNNTSWFAEKQGLEAVCISLQYLIVFSGVSGFNVLENAPKIIDVHQNLLNEALWKICDALPNAEQKQIFMQKLKIVAYRFFYNGSVQDQLIQFSSPVSLQQYSLTPSEVINNSMVDSPESPRSSNNNNDHQVISDGMEDYLPATLLLDL